MVKKYFDKTEQEYIELVKSSGNFSVLNRKLNIANKKYNNDIHRKYIKELGLDIRNTTSRIYQYTDEEFIELVKYSNNYSDILRKIGGSTGGNARKVLKDRIRYLNIPTEHFIVTRKNIISEMKTEDILVKGNKIKNMTIKKYLYENNIKNEECENCGFTGKEVKGNKYKGNIELDLHHKNGDNTDNRIENLEILCPNCHRLTKNFGSKNKKQYEKIDIEELKANYLKEKEEIKRENITVIKYRKNKETSICTNCSKKLKSHKSNYCNKCYKKIREKGILPKEQLQDMLNRFPFTKVGEYCGVSDNAIRKWCNKYGISSKAKDYINDGNKNNN